MSDLPNCASSFANLRQALCKNASRKLSSRLILEANIKAMTLQQCNDDSLHPVQLDCIQSIPCPRGCKESFSGRSPSTPFGSLMMSRAWTCPCETDALPAWQFLFSISGRPGRFHIPRQALQASAFLKRHRESAESAKIHGRLLYACQTCQIVFEPLPRCGKPYAKFDLGNDLRDLPNCVRTFAKPHCFCTVVASSFGHPEALTC